MITENRDLETEPLNILVMGVSGAGKTSIGRGLAEALGLPFVEGDDYHPPANREKMASGQPLDDDDRAPWLAELAGVLAEAEREGGSVLACSALKRAYRQVLSGQLSHPLHVVYLDGSQELLSARLRARKGHFFPPELLDSQFETLERPEGAVDVDISRPIAEVVQQAYRGIQERLGDGD